MSEKENDAIFNTSEFTQIVLLLLQWPEYWRYSFKIVYNMNKF